MEDVRHTAERIATEAHAGQTDKAGKPYIDHPRRVAARLAGNRDAEAAAWLHDVLEDTDLNAVDLVAAGIPARVVEVVQLLTRDGSDDYYERIRRHPLALQVKLADIDDNNDPDRLNLLRPAERTRLRRKYQTASAALMGATLQHDDER